MLQVPAQSNQDLYRRLAVELSEQAVGLPDDDAARRELARRAAELDPSLADPVVILADFLRDEQSAQRERERMLREALAADFVITDRADAVASLAELLLQQQRFQDVLSLLDAEIPPVGGAPLQRILGYVHRPDEAVAAVPLRENLSRLDRLYVAALMGGDAPWFVGGLMQRLRTDFPMDQELGYMDWQRGSDVSLGVLEWLDAVEQLSGTASAEIYRRLLRSDPPSVLVPALVSRYRRADGNDPLVDAIAMVHGLDETPGREALHSDKVVWELLVEHFDQSDLPDDVTRALDEIREADRRVLVRDENRDGFWEERYYFRRGEISLWHHDENQDGRVSTTVATSGGVVSFAHRRDRDDSVVLVEFASYPLVSRVMWIESTGGFEWVPAQPIPFDVGVSELFVDGLWNALAARVTVEGDAFERFHRQRRSDATRALAERDTEEIRSELREWGMIE
ncbi:MAG: hypothetical protein ACOCYB_01020 [Alkalispirochaeta sp.]